MTEAAKSGLILPHMTRADVARAAAAARLRPEASTAKERVASTADLCTTKQNVARLAYAALDFEAAHPLVDLDQVEPLSIVEAVSKSCADDDTIPGMALLLRQTRLISEEEIAGMGPERARAFMRDAYALEAALRRLCAVWTALMAPDEAYVVGEG